MSVSTKTRLGSAAISVALITPIVGAAPAGSAPLIDSSSGAFSFQEKLNAVDCFTRKGRFSDRGTITSLPPGTKDKFYIDKQVRWDRSVGSNGYRNMDTRDTDSPVFQDKDLSTYTTFSDSTIIGSKYLGNGNVVSINLIATLRKVRNGPDKKVWREERRYWLKGQNCIVGGA